jgi:hypothetical protein
MQVRRNSLIRQVSLSFALLAIAAALGAQTPPAPAPQALNWKVFSYPALGFRASFPSEPKLEEKKQDAPLGTILFTSYCAQVADTYLCAAVIDQGPEATGLTPEVLLERMKMGLELIPKTNTLNEKKIDLDGHAGVEVETASDTVHITTRIYLVDNTLSRFVPADPSIKELRLLSQFS